MSEATGLVVGGGWVVLVVSPTFEYDSTRLFSSKTNEAYLSLTLRIQLCYKKHITIKLHPHIMFVNLFEFDTHRVIDLFRLE